MNREIKFRGKRIDNKEWVVGNYEPRYDSFGLLALIVVQDKEDFSITTYQVYPESVGQFIEIKDKNGNEIFEGDTVNIITTGLNWGQQYEWSGVIVFSRGGFIVKSEKNKKVHYTSIKWDRPIFVTGNIYDQVKPAVQDSVIINMKIDPGAKSQEAATEEQAALNAAEDQANEALGEPATESAEEGGTEG